MIGAFITQTVPDDVIDVYLNWREKEGELARRTPGFIKRMLVRNEENPNVFYYTTFWESKEAIHDLNQLPEFQSLAQSTGIRDAMKVIDTHRIWVTEVFDEMGI